MLNPPGGNMPIDFFVSVDVSTSIFKSNCTFSNNDMKQQTFGHDKAKRFEKRNQKGIWN